MRLLDSSLGNQSQQQEYQDFAEPAFSRLSQQGRGQFGQGPQQHAQQQNDAGPGFGSNIAAEQYQDPQYLAQMTVQMHQQQPGLLGGGSGGTLMGSPLAKAALAGIAATAVLPGLGRRHGWRSRRQRARRLLGDWRG